MSTRIIFEKAASPLVLSRETTGRIAAGWKALQSKDSRVYNGTLLRVLESVSPDATSVSVAPDIGYREVVGLRSYTDFLDWVPVEERFQVLSAIAFVETADGVRLLRERNSGDWEHSLELSGGFIVAKDTPDTIDEFIRHRVAEDLSVSPDALTSVERIGHIDFQSICESMFVFKITLAVPFGELVHTQRSFVPIPEGYTPGAHESFFSLPLHPPSRVVLERYL